MAPLMPLVLLPVDQQLVLVPLRRSKLTALWLLLPLRLLLVDQQLVLLLALPLVLRPVLPLGLRAPEPVAPHHVAAAAP